MPKVAAKLGVVASGLVCDLSISGIDFGVVLAIRGLQLLEFSASCLRLGEGEFPVLDKGVRGGEIFSGVGDFLLFSFS